MGRRLVGLATIGVLLFLYIPIGIIFLYSFNADKAQTWPITSWTTELVRHRRRQHGDPGRARAVAGDGRAGHGPRPVPRLAGLVRGPPLPVLRARDDLVPVDPAARPARHRDRHGAQRDVQHDRGAVQHLHDRRRPRHVLRRRRLQQRDRPPASLVGLDRGGVDGPGRRHVADVPVRDVPGHPDRAARRRPARVRPVVRRGHRHDVHRRAPSRRCRSGSWRTSGCPTSGRSSTWSPWS